MGHVCRASKQNLHGLIINKRIYLGQGRLVVRQYTLDTNRRQQLGLVLSSYSTRKDPKILKINFQGEESFWKIIIILF